MSLRIRSRLGGVRPLCGGLRHGVERHQSVDDVECALLPEPAWRSARTSERQFAHADTHAATGSAIIEREEPQIARARRRVRSAVAVSARTAGHSAWRSRFWAQAARDRAAIVGRRQPSCGASCAPSDVARASTPIGCDRADARETGGPGCVVIARAARAVAARRCGRVCKRTRCSGGCGNDNAIPAGAPGIAAGDSD